MTNINDFDTSNKTSEVKVEIKNAPEKPISQPVMEEMVFKKIAETLGLEDFIEMEKEIRNQNKEKLITSNLVVYK